MSRKLVSKQLITNFLSASSSSTEDSTEDRSSSTEDRSRKEVGRRAVKSHHAKRNVSRVAGIDRATILSGQTNFPGYAMWLTMNLDRLCL